MSKMLFMESFYQTLVQYGADIEQLRRFNADSADLLPYATLIGTHQGGDSSLLPLLGVYEWQNNPLVFLIDGTVLNDETQFTAIRRRLALRGDVPYLGVVKPGQLTLYRIALDDSPTDRCRLGAADLPAAPHATFAHLAYRRPGLKSNRRWIADVVLKLLGEAITTLIQKANVSDPDAISLVGRALFVRFLSDRNLLSDTLLANQSAKSLFDSADKALATCHWLDDTFNGDLLPYSPGLIERLSPDAFKTLSNILHGAPGGQLLLNWKEDWAHLDFAYIPVGVLSQAYEHYQRQHTPEQQAREGGYYTPRPIADLMVRGSFHALRRDGLAHRTRILDPAVGAGVFLITAFRELVAERWRHDGRRPDTKILRDILYKQLAGFDINEAGLRFAALGLYLLSIELDPDPEPVQKLSFELDLRGRVLFKVDEEGSLGSLGPNVSDEHLSRYDLVIGNPPWSSSTGLEDWTQVAQRVQSIARKRLPADVPAPRLPNEVLDLPFVWRAMEWARPGGQIAFALHGRLLFQQGEGMPDARTALFSALNVTGVVNGAELRQTKVWPGISAPFCLLYARNETPPPGSGFRFVSPHLEDALNGNGGLRIDAGNAETVSAHQVEQQPEILKILFRGGPLSLEVYDRIADRRIGTLESYWAQRFGTKGRRLRYAGNGYQNLRKSSKACHLCAHLIEKPELPVRVPLPLLLDPKVLPRFDQQGLHRSRSDEIFSGPLLIVHQSPPAHAGRIRVSVSDADVVFNESYYGYSAHTHPDGALLVRYLALLIGSKPAYWHALITSGKFGFEREVVEKSIIDTIPAPPFDQLPPADRDLISSLFDAVVRSDDEASWEKVDAWVAELYGLCRRDLEVIADTLRFNLPFAANRKAAQCPPTTDERQAFCTALKIELLPWAQRYGKHLNVTLLEPSAGTPWGLLIIDTTASPEIQISNDWPAVLKLADSLAAAETILVEPNGLRLWVARLAQARYWSCSCARLLARRIVWEHADQFFGSEVI